MYQLWHTAEKDMLYEHYRLQDTGQGLNRVQHCPRTGKQMHQILSMVQGECVREKGQRWAGLSVVHLGDRDVPNALVFIDKYTQVPRILGPIVQVIERLPVLYTTNDSMRKYIDDFGGCES